MLLTHRQLEKRGYGLTSSTNIAALELRWFSKDDEERGVKLGLELVAKIKVYRKLNSFLSKIGSVKVLDCEPIYPVIRFVIGDSENLSLEDKEIKAFFQLEKDFHELDDHLDDLLNQPTWGFGYEIHAGVIGLSLHALNYLEYTNDNNVIQKFESFENLCIRFLSGRLGYDEFIFQAKRPLDEIQKEVDELRDAN